MDSCSVCTCGAFLYWCPDVGTTQMRRQPAEVYIAVVIILICAAALLVFV